MNKSLLLLFSVTIFFISNVAEAQRRSGGSSRRGVSLSGEHSLSFGVGLITAEQNNLDTLIDNANTGGGNVKNFESGLELFTQYGIRFDGSWWGVVFRPSYMSQSTDGTCNTGQSCKYSVTGYSFFPMIKMVPLENELIKLFFQFGLGYGSMNGEIKQGTGSMKFKGSAFGTIAGLGVDFCLTESHCVTVEGNLRYLPIERNLVTSTNGTFTAGLTGANSGDEVEYNGSDLSTTLSGLQGMVSYTIMF